MTLIIMTTGAQAQGCTPNHELYRIVPEYRAIMLDGGEVKRVMFVDMKDERLKLWKPGHNIRYCPDENKMINTTINSVATLLSEFAATSCKPLQISDAIDRWLQKAWDYTNTPTVMRTFSFMKQNPISDGTIKFAPTTRGATGSRTKTSRIFCMSRHP
jgi:hypothetical protein